MDTPQIEPNLEAKFLRHKRVFLKNIFFSRIFFRLMLDLKSIFRGRRRSHVFIESAPVIKDSFSKFLRQTAAVGVALLVVTSIAPTGILETGFTADYFDDDTDFSDDIEPLPELPYLINEEGFVLKPSPASEEVSRIGFTDSVTHTVAPGDTLSAIASIYSVSVNTILWENNISEDAPLRVGQKLTVPSVDGVGHIVTATTETLSTIAKDYGVDQQLIKDHNKLETDTIAKGQKLFIPGGKKRQAVIVVRSGGRETVRVVPNTFQPKVAMGSDDTPDPGKNLIFPTVGKITQGFRAGHYALDIGNSSQPDIWAAAAGTVTSVTTGCPNRNVRLDRRCGSGYGNHVVIDHGNGLTTLYAHCAVVFVSEGDMVQSGQDICQMGSSGRVFGATGIHLHFECTDNGVKKNCSKYY